MNPLQKLVDYVKSSKAELLKVSWPSKQDTIRYSVLVIVASAIVAIFFAVLDIGLERGIGYVLRNRAFTAPVSEPVTPTTQVPGIQVQPIQAEGTDAQGNPINLKVNPLPINATK
jgi:preprotein translocase subunit SecE